MNVRGGRHALLQLAEPLRQRASGYGHKRGWEWLEYDPLTMWYFHRVTIGDAGPIAEALERCFPDADSLVDVGAGTGAMAAAWKRRGHQVIVCERNAFGRIMARFQGVDARRFSLQDEPPATVGSGFDLAMCLEVAEHVPESLAPRLVDFLAGLAPTIVFSHAPEGQGGHFHINERPWSYWERLFGERSVIEDQARTDELQATLPACGCDARFRIDNTRVLVKAPEN